jgi:predicted DNA-binding protein (UPF0251 family)/DNA-directed RNA polymerase subunit RPC12/RpoP
MPRRKTRRRVSKEPIISVYKPAGIPANELEEILLSVDEFEAIRLADLEGINQRQASKKMHVSQPTFNRILSSARTKVARGLVEGNVLRIEGGNYILADGTGFLKCLECGATISSNLEQVRECPECGSSRLRWRRMKPMEDSKRKETIRRETVS